MDLEFEWDDLKRHKISFDEAKTVFADPFSMTIDDPQHSSEEYRFIDLGTSAAGNVLVVPYTERKKIRLISARKASRKERGIYEQKEGF